MPELPEVETTRRGLVPLITNKVITAVDVRQPALRRLVDTAAMRALCGLHFTTLARRAKYLLLHTSDAQRSLLVHLGMSGSMRVNSVDAPLKKHDHIIMTLTSDTSLRYHDPRRFGQCDIIDPNRWPAYLQRLGAEPLDECFDGAYLLQRARGRNIAVKTLIMDQSVVVGVGNIYAAEALFYSKIHPNSVAGAVTPAAYRALAAEIKTVLTRAIAQGGTTLRDFLHSDGRAGYFQQTLAVYGKSGEPCPVCGSALHAMTISGRNSVYCANCQRMYR